MESENPRARGRTAKRLRRIGIKAKPSRSKPRKQQPRKSVRVKPVALGNLSQSLGYRIRRAQLWVFKEVSRKLASLDISPAQYSVLCVIDANPGVNQLAIAQVLSIERAGLGRLVDHLEQRGLVARTASAINRRYYVLHLTDVGAVLLARLRSGVAEAEKDLAKKVGTRAYRQLQQALSIFLND
jgi:DNA-binding MarR family transcriptional regulator